MARMKELYEDIRELFEQGLSELEIATVTGMPLTMINDCVEQFIDEEDELEGFEFDDVAAADFSFDEIEY
jgi:hypothetical protein